MGGSSPDGLGVENAASGRPRSQFSRRAILVAALVLPVGLLLLVAFALGQLQKGGEGSGALSVAARLAAARVDGQPAPQFALPPVQGTRKISLRQFSGKVVVLNFWASWCGPCRQEAPHLQAVWQAYAARGVQFLGIDHQDKRAGASAFQREFRITYPSVYDPEGNLATKYGLVGIPSTFVIDGGGHILYRFLGKVDEPLLRATLDRVLSGAVA